MKNKGKKLLGAVLALALVLGLMLGMSLTAFAECKPTNMGNTTELTYDFSDGNVTIQSITTPFSYIDSGYFQNISGEKARRYYNMIFTTDASKPTGYSTTYQSGKKWNDLAQNIGSAIFSNDAQIGGSESNVEYQILSHQDCIDCFW